MEHQDQRQLERKGLISWQSLLTGHHQKQGGQELKQGGNLEAGADAQAMKGAAYWLAFNGLLSLLSDRTQNRQHPQETWCTHVND